MKSNHHHLPRDRRASSRTSKPHRADGRRKNAATTSCRASAGPTTRGHRRRAHRRDPEERTGVLRQPAARASAGAARKYTFTIVGAARGDGVVRVLAIKAEPHSTLPELVMCVNIRIPPAGSVAPSAIDAAGTTNSTCGAAGASGPPAPHALTTVQRRDSAAPLQQRAVGHGQPQAREQPEAARRPERARRAERPPYR